MVLDFLTRRLSPNVITGFVINDVHWITKENVPEAFLTKILKKENPVAWVKCFSNNAAMIARGGPFRVEKLMKSLQIDNLYVYPRIRHSIKQCLDKLPNLKIEEYDVEFSQKAYKIH